MQPTDQAYGELRTAYEHFNKELFDKQLPPCLFTLQRRKNTYGYFAREQFVNVGGNRIDEIAINPSYFAVVPLSEVMQTLTHESVHLWQFHYGKPGRRGYHNKEWAMKMIDIGLMPSDTGKPGGRTVGEQMADYIITGGRFEAAFQKLLKTKFAITWKDRFPVRTRIDQIVSGESEDISIEELTEMDIVIDQPESKSNRIKYTCKACSINVWGKPKLNLICGECHKPFVANGT